jgi:hypothetical protein
MTMSQQRLIFGRTRRTSLRAALIGVGITVALRSV